MPLKVVFIGVRCENKTWIVKAYGDSILCPSLGFRHIIIVIISHMSILVDLFKYLFFFFTSMLCKLKSFSWLDFLGQINIKLKDHVALKIRK